jgi:LPS export ABC transporter permease LptF/LPS export ABC transporter permease LptG
MGLLFRTAFREVASSALLGTLLFTFVLFLQKSAEPFRFLVNNSASPSDVAWLFALLLPATFPFTLPLGVLVGVLIALSRMSSDGEITALRASGVPGRRLAAPVLTFAVLAAGVTATASLWLTPASIREFYRLINQVGAAQLTAEIQPRVFEENFPHTILYVGDVVPGTPVRWRNVFLADVTPAGERRSEATQKGEGPRITVAAGALASADATRNRIQLSLLQGRTYEPGANPAEYYTSEFPRGEQVLEARERGEVRARYYSATDTPTLYAQLGESVEARIEFHQRFALPLACLLLALTGMPLGVSSRKGGKSAAFVITVLFAFLYYMALVSLIGLARDRRIPAELAVWAPDLVFALAGLLLLITLERPGERDVVSGLRGWFAFHWDRLRSRLPDAGPASPLLPGRRWFLLPQVVDTYVLGSFLFYFTVLLLSFVALTEFYNFFELLGDVFRRNIPMAKLFRYLFYLTPKLIFDAAPVSVLVGVLVTFGILTKNNEITAMKACGISLHRLALPILFGCLFLSAALFAFDHYVVTAANLVQDALRNEIKGRAVQTYLSPDRKWIFGQGNRIYYYKVFEQGEGVMGGVSVFDLDPKTFRVVRHLAAERARWEPALHAWVFQNGWVRSGIGARNEEFRDFTGAAATFPELNEPPAWFLKEVKTYKQMNFRQLDHYIAELQQSGFNTVPLLVQFHKKFSAPSFVLIMAMLSVPFAFLTGGRGAMTGVGVSFGVAIAYFAVNLLFEQLGNVNQLPPQLAAWAPGALFAMSGVLLMTRMRT